MLDINKCPECGNNLNRVRTDKVKCNNCGWSYSSRLEY